MRITPMSRKRLRRRALDFVVVVLKDLRSGWVEDEKSKYHVLRLHRPSGVGIVLLETLRRPNDDDGDHS